MQWPKITLNKYRMGLEAVIKVASYRAKGSWLLI